MSREAAIRRARSIERWGQRRREASLLALQLLLHRQIDGVAVVSGAAWDFDDYAEILRCLVTVRLGLLLFAPGEAGATR